MAAVLGGTKPDSAATLDQVLSYFSSSSRITLNWAFPSYTSFNPALAPYGDVALAASAIEKSVGQTWSDPAVGPIFNSSGPYSVMLGSGFLPYSVQQQANRGGSVIAGTTFYLLNVKDRCGLRQPGRHDRRRSTKRTTTVASITAPRAARR